MNYYLIDLSKEYDFNFDNIIIGKKIQINENNSKYYIYYQPDEDNISKELYPKEIYIKLPKLRLIYNMVNYKYKTMNIPIYPSWEITDNMVDFIKTLENDILKCFKKNNMTISSLISRKNNIDFIRVTNNNAIITTDVKDNISLNNFKVNGMIEMVLKISYIWKKDDKIGLESELYQIKYYPPPEDININFIDDYEEKPTIIQSTIKPHTSVLPPQISNFLQIPSEQPKLFINADLLKSVKLKSVEKN